MKLCFVSLDRYYRQKLKYTSFYVVLLPITRNFTLPDAESTSYNSYNKNYEYHNRHSRRRQCCAAG